MTVTPNLWLYVPGNHLCPTCPVADTTATYEGFVNIDLRGDYSFRTTGKGGVKLEVNNAVLTDLEHWRGGRGQGPVRAPQQRRQPNPGHLHQPREG